MFEYTSKTSKSLWISPRQLPQRILSSFIPRMRRTSIDLVGPVLAVVLLVVLLYHGHAHKKSSAATTLSPAVAMVLYIASMPLMTYLLVRLGQGVISLLEAFVIIGYGLFGHVFTFVASLILNNEESNTVFFCCMATIGGLSALRLAIALLIMIPRPASRLIVCSVVATMQMLSLIFLHFTYMHSTFRYGHRV